MKAANTGMVLTVAFDYGGRSELVAAVEAARSSGEGITVESIGQLIDRIGTRRSTLLFAVLCLIGAIVTVWAMFSFEALLGILVFFGKSFALVALFVLMRATYPRVRIDQMMNFAWKWLMPAALLNLFITAAAIIVVKEYL